MKKTLIALIALAGVAVAGESLTLTTGIKYNDTVYNGYTDPNVTGLGYTYVGYPGYTTSSISFTIALGELYGADEILSSDVITLNSLTLKVNANGWSLDGNRAITLSIEGNTAYSYSQKLANNTTYVNRDGAELTMSNINWSGLTTDSVITLTLGGTKAIRLHLQVLPRENGKE